MIPAEEAIATMCPRLLRSIAGRNCLIVCKETNQIVRLLYKNLKKFFFYPKMRQNVDVKDAANLLAGQFLEGLARGDSL